LRNFKARPPAKKPKRKPAVKAKPARKLVKVPKATGIDQILALLGESQKGIDIKTLRTKRGISDNNLRASLYRMKKRGLIKSAGRGVYVRS
jgi:predicted transcriptional regulator of viral defense system